MMNARHQSLNESLSDLQKVTDLLPTPDELAYREESIKITITLSKKSVEFFKAEASKRHTQYQRMIRRLLDSYVETQSPD